MNCINRNLIFFLKKLPDWCTGKREVYEAAFRARYGNRDCSDQIEKEKIYRLKSYCIVISGFLFLLLVFCVTIPFTQNKALHSVARPNYGETPGVISLRAEVLQGEETFSKKVTLRVRPQSLTELQKKELLKDCKKRLAAEILGKNPDLQHIRYKLDLPKEDSQYPIHIEWSSNQPSYVEENGSIHRIGLKRPLQVSLRAQLMLHDLKEEHLYKIIILPAEKDKELEEELSTVLQDVTKVLNNDTYGEKLFLPSKLTKQTSIRWYVQNTIPIFPMLAMALLLLMLLYKKRYVRMEKELQSYRESMQKEYPDFINKVVLLLNAGLVITTALERIAMDSKGRKDRPLMEAIGEICHNVRETNASFSKELKIFARRSGLRELMRFAAIVCDNLDKGSSLAEKLEAEGELLWMGRKKAAEEEGRKAETKLILPLMVLLLILVIITISPVLIQM